MPPSGKPSTSRATPYRRARRVSAQSSGRSPVRIEGVQAERRSPSRVRRAARRASTGAREAASRAQPAGRARRGWAARVTAAALPSEQVSSAVTPLPPDEPQNDGKSVVPLIIGGGVTALALAGGIGFRIAASSTEDDANELRDKLGVRGACNGASRAGACTRIRDDYESADDKYNLSTVSFAVAGAAAVATAVYYVWPRTKRREALLPAGVIHPRAAQFVLTGNF